MVKKKYLTLLGILLLSLFLGSFGTCYATSFSQNDLKNIFYNSLTNFGTLENKNDVKVMLQATDFSSWARYSTEYDYTFIACPIRTGVSDASLYMFFDNITDKKSMYNYIHYTRYVYARYSKTNNTITFQTDYAPNSPTYLQQNGFNASSWRFNDLNFYSNTSSNTITLDNGWHPNNIDDGEFVDRYWSFTPSNNNRVLVPSFTTFPNTEFTPISVNESNLGTLVGGLHCDQIRIVRVYYSGGEWVMSKGVTWYQWPRNGTLLNFTGGSNANDWTCPININFSNYANNIIAIQFNSNDDTYDSIRHWFYITDNNTQVSGGVVGGNTFSGDYYNEYIGQQNVNNINDNNDNNTEQIIDTITDDSQVDSIIADNFSGDINGLASSWGFTTLQNPFVSFIYNFLVGCCNVMLDDGDIVLDLGHHGDHMYIHSDDIYLNSNSVIGQLVYYATLFGFLYAMYIWFNHIIRTFETADIETLKHDLGTDEFYYKDGKYM